MPSPHRLDVPNEGLMARVRERPLTLAAGALVCGALPAFRPCHCRSKRCNGAMKKLLMLLSAVLSFTAHAGQNELRQTR